jgi:hypothetical protein
VFQPAWTGQLCSLGYQVGPFIEADLGITLTGEQQDRILRYYELDPITGKRVVRRAAVRRPKGAGKSPEGACCAYAELVGPIVFAGWTDDGQPMGKRHHDPWVQLAAVSEDQTANVLVWLFDTLASRREVCQERGIDLGRTRLYLVNRPGRLEPVTAAAGSREGQRVTFAVMDQTEAWTKENGGHRLADVLRRNVGKMASTGSGWTLELQNAPGLGDGSVADRTGKASERRSAGVLFDTREPPNADRINMADPAQLREALEYSYGESVAWVDIDRLIQEILDPDTDPGDAKRYYLNVAAPSSDWAFDRGRWGELGGTDLVPHDDSLIVAGFDGARFDDSTAIVAVDVATGAAWLHAVWERPDQMREWEVPEDEVTRAVEELFTRWRVWRIYCDPPYWESSVASWEARYKGADRKPAVVSWWTNRWRQVGYACRSLGSAIRSGEITHQVDGTDDILSRHVRNAVRRAVNARDEDGFPLWSITKPAPGRKIDAAMALVLAWEARNDAIAAGVRLRKARVAGFR